MKTKILSFICVFLLICLFSGCIDSTEHNTPINLFENLTLKQKYTMLEDNDNWYYFDDGIFKISKNDGIKTLIHKTEAWRTSYLNRGWIYYVDANWDICRVKTSGQDYSVVLNVKQFWQYDEQPVHSLIVVDNKLFIQMTFALYYYDMETKTTIEVYADARQVETYGEDIYFCGRESTIYKMSIHDDKPQSILKSEKNGDYKTEWKNLYKNFIFIDGVMYYYKRNPDGLYRYQNGESTMISNNSHINEFSLFEHDKKLYYVVLEDHTGKLLQYDMKTNTISEILACSNFRSGPKIINEYFYYQDLEYKVQREKIN